ncbi:M20 metallopeptidase family protein [Romboutsia sp. 1001713B170207_170306_H8]|uniref:M20 metallopeptidase family protein n=1 Tax=Romboutsia sp. 1001713B170207_170306_H8 TaxID=2787112 RepID=UPI00189C165A|nr:amidohydrolase [Romboutsia sp. 1001713B170207_170306_H8]
MNDIEALFEKLKNHRNKLHNIGEIGRKEYNTSKYIRSYLDKLGIEYSVYIETGTVGIIKGKNPIKTIAFRSDIDALSTENGVKHLCGHDGHMSILLGLIEYLNNNRHNLNDNIVFIFQPAEEAPGGAEEMIKQGVLKYYNVDEIYGLHIYPEIPEGYIGLRDGYFLAQGAEIDINITAKSAHGAMPQNGIDATVVASSLISNLQSIVSRNLSPIDNGVITIGKLNAGSVRNIVAENAYLEGTMRTFSPETYAHMKKRIKEVVSGCEVMYNCKIDAEIRDFYPAVNNDKKLYDEFINIIGEDKIIKLDPLMISEDFSYYQKEVPGLFFMLGSRNEEKGYINGLHNINFNFDEKIFLNALEIYIKLLKAKKSLN